MRNEFQEVLKWALIAFGAAPYALAIVRIIVEHAILPARIPREEIERLADKMMARYPDDPERAAFIEEEAAWFRSESVEQGKWRRVRKAIRQRVQASNHWKRYGRICAPCNLNAASPYRQRHRNWPEGTVVWTVKRKDDRREDDDD